MLSPNAACSVCELLVHTLSQENLIYETDAQFVNENLLRRLLRKCKKDAKP